MPLILMCGLPCSGKSTRAEELRSKLSEEYGVTGYVVGEESCCNLQRNEVFNSSAVEKELRANIRSDIQRKISHEHEVVIVDSPNYIKGYRYELFCISKANQATFCVVHCDTSTDSAWNWNTERLPEEVRYSRETFDALVTRFETPDSRNRWDSPLFTIQPDDQLPLQLIYNCLFLKKPLPANQSTQSQPLLDTNFLYNLDKLTQDIVYSILEAQRTRGIGDEIALPNATTKLRLEHKFTPTELARLRRQFVLYSKMHPVEDGKKCSNMFVRYLGGGSLD